MAGPLKRSWLDRLRRRNREVAGDPAAASAGDPLLEAGNRLRQAREARGLGLRQLAAETLISTPVLEALERGWRDRLPETAYLRTMLPLLERYLELESGSLRAALADAAPSTVQRRGGSTQLPWLSVQLFSTWQGSAAYGALLLALVYGLNLEQRRLGAQGLLALQPIQPLSEAAVRRLPPVGSELLLTIHPELRPLALARGDRGLALLRRQVGEQAISAAPGVLELTLRQSTRLSLEAANGLRTNLQADAGELVLPLTPPLTLTLGATTTAAADVRWNGEPLRPVAPGRYSWPPRPVSAASSP